MLIMKVDNMNQFSHFVDWQGLYCKWVLLKHKQMCTPALKSSDTSMLSEFAVK